MKFMMLVCVDPDRFTEDEAAAADTAENSDADNMGSFPWLDDVVARGIRLHGDRLRRRCGGFWPRPDHTGSNLDEQHDNGNPDRLRRAHVQDEVDQEGADR